MRWKELRNVGVGDVIGVRVDLAQVVAEARKAEALPHAVERHRVRGHCASMGEGKCGAPDRERYVSCPGQDRQQWRALIPRAPIGVGYIEVGNPAKPRADRLRLDPAQRRAAGSIEEPERPRAHDLKDARAADPVVEQVAVSPAYLARLNDPTAWTASMMGRFRGMIRGFCSVAASSGFGLGNAAVSVRFSPAEGAEDELSERIAREVLPALSRRRGMAGAHLLRPAPPPAFTKCTHSPASSSPRSSHTSSSSSGWPGARWRS